MIRVGITGQQGFIGSHLFNFLGLQNDIELVHFERSFFENDRELDDFITKCDTIVHLAALNRHEDPNKLFETNLSLVEKLIFGCKRNHALPHIIFSSSTQEEADNLYGKSKLEGRAIIEKWAIDSGGNMTGLVIPNVFGPFGRPFYNSVVATFCHQLANGQDPTIIMDSTIKLIYITDLVGHIYKVITSRAIGKIIIPFTRQIKVSEILSLLNSFSENYLKQGIFPDLSDEFEKAMFNTFRCFIPNSHYPVLLKNNVDIRGNFVEIARTNSFGQFSFSTTFPNITRGNHFHTRKAERFSVIKGKALIQLRKIGTVEIIDYYLDGDSPSFVDMPIWHTHNIKNIGETELITLFWINEPYDEKDPDTYFVNV